jgi:hypothetical protein
MLSLIKTKISDVTQLTIQTVDFLETGSKIYPGNVTPWGIETPKASFSVFQSTYSSQMTYAFGYILSLKSVCISTDLHVTS